MGVRCLNTFPICPRALILQSCGDLGNQGHQDGTDAPWGPQGLVGLFINGNDAGDGKKTDWLSGPRLSLQGRQRITKPPFLSLIWPGLSERGGTPSWHSVRGCFPGWSPRTRDVTLHEQYQLPVECSGSVDLKMPHKGSWMLSPRFLRGGN